MIAMPCIRKMMLDRQVIERGYSAGSLAELREILRAVQNHATAYLLEISVWIEVSIQKMTPLRTIFKNGLTDRQWHCS